MPRILPKKIRTCLPLAGCLAAVGLFCSVLPACDTYRSTLPPVRVDFVPYHLNVLHGARVRLAVLDQRANPRDSEILVTRLRKSLTNALRTSGVPVAPDGDAELQVAVTQLSTELVESTRQGCAHLTARLTRGALDRIIEADRCDPKLYRHDYPSAQEALTESFNGALDQLLVGIAALDQR